MPRTTKIGKTQINQTIKTGDRVTVGVKRNQTVKVALANPQKDDLDTCNLSEDLKQAALEDAKAIAEAKKILAEKEEAKKAETATEETSEAKTNGAASEETKEDKKDGGQASTTTEGDSTSTMDEEAKVQLKTKQREE